MPNDERDNPGILVPPPLIYLLPLLLGLALDRRVHVGFLPHSVARIVGWPLVGGAVALAGWASWTMRAADTTTRPDKPASRVVQRGPFGFSRNPIYVSFTMLYSGIAVLRNALWPLALLPFVLYVIQREVIGREERYLERSFGEEYLTYKARVRRWV